MVNDTVATYLIFEKPNPPDIYNTVARLLSQGWELDKHHDEYQYNVDGTLKWSSAKEEVLEEIQQTSSAYVAVRRDGLKVYIVKNSSKPWVESLPNVELWTSAIDLQHTGRGKSEREALENVELYLEAIKTAARTMAPSYGFGTWPDETDPSDVPTRSELEDGRIKQIFWLNIFPTELLETLEGDTGEEIPAYEVEQLSDDLTLVLVAANPAEPTDQWRDDRKQVAHHLGIET